MDAHVHRAHGRELLLGAVVLPRYGEDYRVRRGHLRRRALGSRPAHISLRYRRAPHPPVLRRAHRCVGREALACHRQCRQRRGNASLPRPHGIRSASSGAHRARFRFRHHVGVSCRGGGARHTACTVRGGHRVFLYDAGVGNGGGPVRRHSHHERCNHQDRCLLLP